MDFGMDLSFGPKNKNKKLPNGLGHLNVPPQKHTRGLSLEDPNSPYFFPAAGRNSVDSLASLGRSIRHDPFHPGKADDMSIRSPSPFTRRDTNSTAAPSMFDTNAGLLGHAQSNPRSVPPRGQSLPIPPELPQQIQEPEKAMLAAANNSPPKHSGNGGLGVPANEQSRESYVAQEGFRKSNNYLGQFIHSRDASVDPFSDKETKVDGSPKVDSESSTLMGSESSGKNSGTDYFKDMETVTPGIAVSPPGATRNAPGDKAEHHEVNDKFQSIQGSIHNHNPNTQSYLSDNSNYNHYGDTEFKVTPASPPRNSQSTVDPRHSDYRNSVYSRDSGSQYNTAPPRGQSLAAPMPGINEHHDDQQHMDEGLRDLDFNDNRLSVFMRPLPPDEPNENPEERANRIRSFYKEYFDDSKGAQGQGQQPPQQHAQQPHAPQPQHPPQQSRAEYYEDYDSEYLNNGYTIYDEQQNGFVVGGAPFAQPITRRAMTPPPRAPPRNFRARSGSNAPGPRYPGPGSRAGSRAGSSMSGYMTPPRAGSSMSSFRGRPPQKKALPPPDMLMSLKTPALLKEDSALYAAYDLAPPPSFRQRQNGMRPDSPLGTERPYSPTVRAHTPVKSSYDELSPMPSPHLLRRSGTFTALDFAPIPRIRGVETGSDAASIRSGGSGMSAAQAYAIRSGAHRLSRLPKNLAGTKDDIMADLRPTCKSMISNSRYLSILTRCLGDIGRR
jgi:hypothetical protein